jgi:hypothetical protein
MRKPMQSRKNKKTSSKKTSKNVPWRGWKDVKPTSHGRTVMEEKCGKKCFLGPYKSFPICDMNTCKVDKKGVWAAYIRAKEWATRSKTLKKKHASYHVRHPYSKIARSAKRMLYKNKGGLFGFFESKNPLIKLHKSSSSFEQKDYETKVREYIKSILVNDGKDVNNVSDNVKEYFNTYKISSDNCTSDENKKILTTYNEIYKFLNKFNKKPDNEKTLDEKFLIPVFNANIKTMLKVFEDTLNAHSKDCKDKRIVKEEKDEDEKKEEVKEEEKKDEKKDEVKEEEKYEERPRSNSDPQPKRRSLFGKPADNKGRRDTGY